jgi:ABC-type transporter Mla subunit MlaD
MKEVKGMKLAEALANRADLQRRVEQLRGRLQKSALVQEGESPPEDPQDLLEETERIVSELEGYVRRINRTNLAATLPGSETTLTDALARRDALALRYGNLKTLVSTASDRLPRYGRAEIRILPAVEVAPLRRRMDELARERRELDTAIQQANWATDLVEG